MKTFLAIALLSLTAAAQAPLKKPGQAQTPPKEAPPPPGPAELKPKVLALITGYELEPKREDWDKLGPKALDVLVAIAQDDTALPSTRTRAIASMNHFDAPSVSTHLATFASQKTLPWRLRATAAEVLVARDGEKALPQVAPMLSSADPLVREAAAKSIARLGTATARKTLESRLEKEEDAAVREAIQQGLRSPR